jgi:hypothetical protein
MPRKPMLVALVLVALLVKYIRKTDDAAATAPADVSAKIKTNTFV